MQCLVTTDEKINKLKSSIDNLRQNFIKDSLMTEHDEANEKADQWKRELAAAKRVQASSPGQVDQKNRNAKVKQKLGQ